MSSFNENELIAFHLHELSPQRARELYAALENDPQLAAESAAIAATLSELRAGSEAQAMTAAGLAAVSDHHWQRLRPALVEARGSAFGWWKPFTLGTLCGLVLPSLFFLFHAATPTALPPSPPGVAAVGEAAAPAPQAVPVMGERGGNGTGGAVRWRVATCAVTPLQTEVAEREEQKPRITNELGGTLAPPQVASFDWREAPLLPGSAATGMAVASPQPTPDAEPPVALPFVVKPRANHHSVSVTAAALGNLTVGRSAVSVETVAGTALGDAQTVSESSAPGALVSVETPVFRMISLRLDGAIHTSRYTYTAGNFTSSTTSNSFFQTGGIQERQVEFTPSAVLTVPTSGRISPYVQLGGGMLVFAPHDNPNMAIHRAYRSTGLVGGGAKIHLTDHLDLTAGYRGVIYRTPEISYGYIKQASINESFPVLVRRTLSSQPFLGLTYTFGKGRNN